MAKVIGNIVEAEYISVWDGEDITTNCKVNLETGEVFDIETTDVDNNLNSCEGEFVEFENGERIKVEEKDGEYFIKSHLENFERFLKTDRVSVPDIDYI